MDRRRLPLVVALVLSPAPAAVAQCTFEEDDKLLPGDGAAGDAYGGPLSVSGDVLVVGAPRADGVGPDSGAAYVHRRVDGEWTEEAKLTSSDPEAFADYGVAVDVEGDVIVVGALFDDVAAVDDGSAFVYRYDGQSWIEEQRLLASDPAAGDRFGRTVGVQGDWIAVGAYRSDDLGANSGSVYLFQREGGVWVERQKLLASDGTAGDLYGVDLEFSGDALLVGSYFDDAPFIDSGSAYVYRYDGMSWKEDQKLVPADAEAGDVLGAFVAIQGDTAVLGAYGGDAAGTDSGAAYVFEFDGSSWNETQKLAASDGSPGDEFGWGVALDGDVLCVGAYFDDEEGYKAGSAYVYRHDGATWIEERKLLASDATPMDLFATDVSVDGTDLWIGANGGDDAGLDSGSAYRFDVRPLRLDVDPPEPATGQTLTITTAPGPPGNLAALFAVELAGVPVLQHVITLPYGADCRMELAVTVPPGFGGFTASLQSYGFTMAGAVEATNEVTVSFL